MTGTNGHRIRVDQATFTLRELAEVDRVTGGAMTDVGTPGTGPELMAAMAYVVARRTDPTFTYEQALELHTGDVEMVESPEVSGDVGGTPRPSPESGG